MIDLDSLLEPIAGPDPSGQDLRSAPIYLQIREARREEDEAEQGVWKREIKKADFPLVVRLATEALRKSGKELQIAAWLTEALVSQDGMAGLRQGLVLLHGLLERFWDTVYPQPDEDGDLEFRATPLQWVGSQMDRVVRRVPLTSNGFSWLDYHESKSVPTEAVAERDSAKRALRHEALNRQLPTPEVIEDAFLATPPAHYDQVLAEVQGAQDALAQLGELCDQRFGDVAPNFAPLRDRLDEAAQTLRVFRGKLAAPQAATPTVQSQPSTLPKASAGEDNLDFDAWPEPFQAAAPAPPPPPPAPPAPDAGPAVAALPKPALGDTFTTLAALAAQLREQDMFNPAPYLLLRGARWGELYGSGEDLDPGLLEAPPADIRVDLRRLSQEGEWEQMLAVTERAAALPCGRAWLDLQRYTVRAADECGYSGIARAVRSQLAALLAVYPRLIDESLNDDTPAANAETRAWLNQEVLRANAPAEAKPAWRDEETADEVDPYELALEHARSGRVAQAFEMLTAHSAHEPSGRGRFLARLRLAQLCLATSHQEIAQPILKELEEEMDQRRLSEWEAGGLLSQPLSMLYRCSDSSDEDTRQRLYSQICRLDPARALALETP